MTDIDEWARNFTPTDEQAVGYLENIRCDLIEAYEKQGETYFKILAGKILDHAIMRLRERM